jgi:hypothetical protein
VKVAVGGAGVGGIGVKVAVGGAGVGGIGVKVAVGGAGVLLGATRVFVGPEGARVFVGCVSGADVGVRVGAVVLVGPPAIGPVVAVDGGGTSIGGLVGNTPIGRGVTVGNSTISTPSGVAVGALIAGGTTPRMAVGALPTITGVGVPRSAMLVSVTRSAAWAAGSSGGMAAIPRAASHGE